MKNILFFNLLIFIFSCCNGTNNVKQENKKLALLEKKLKILEKEKKIRDSIEQNTFTILTTANHPISDKAIIKLFNISINSLGDEFISYFDKSIKPTFKIMDKKIYTIGKNEYILAILGINNPNDDHVHQGNTCLGLLKYVNEKWTMHSIKKNLDGGFGFGDPSPIEKIYQFGKKNLAVSLLSGYTGMGVDESRRVLYGIIDENFYKIFENEKKYNNEYTAGVEDPSEFEYIDNESKISFEKSTNNFYTLKIIKTSFGKVQKTSLLRFNEKLKKY
jgi:hypothetical protein